MELQQQIPRATMTGIRTFISGQGMTRAQDSQIMQSVADEEQHCESPLKRKAGDSIGEINVQHDIRLVAEIVRR